MQGRLFYFFCLMVLSFYLPSCNSFKEPDFKRIDNINLDKLGVKESTLSLNLYYFNPNNSKLKLKEVQGKAWLDGNAVAANFKNVNLLLGNNTEFAVAGP